MQRFLGVLRVLSVYTLLALLFAFSVPTFATVSVGFAFVAVGEALRVWAAGHLVKTTTLVTSGPYRYTRNPLYLGRLLIFTGITIMCRLPYQANWYVLLGGFAVFFGYYMPRKERVEPARLRLLHADSYETYHRAVPSLFPSLRPWPGASSAGWHSARMLRNREHWMVLGLGLVSLWLLWRAHVGIGGL
jgi:protein-S-isoprenylcysteine O-methyltransferase Ste14